ncbi:MAG: LysR family transcriptional regulator [Proteobacteria bacterium]|nr:LysR family transcriptional regulator [Pseudomonadota bacterium]
MLPDFNRLKVFYHIFTTGSVAAAAKELHVTQSAVSQHLQKLETEIETLLFTRLHKRLVPTAAGEKLYAVMQPFIGDLENVMANMLQARQDPCGTIRIGAPVEFGEGYLPGILASFKARYPEVGFHLELGHPTILLPLLREGRLDFVFADIYSKKGEFSRELAVFSIEPFLTEELILVGSKSYHENHIGDEPSWETLLKADYISYQQHAPAVRSWFNHHFGKSSVRLHVVMTVESVRGVVAAIKHHMGLGIVPSHLVREELEGGEIVPVATSGKEMVNRISLVQLQDKIPSLTEKTFLSHFKDEIRATGVF